MVLFGIKFIGGAEDWHFLKYIKVRELFPLKQQKVTVILIVKLVVSLLISLMQLLPQQLSVN
jgi:hypothetical protein